MITIVITNYNKPKHLVYKCLDSVKKYNLKYLLINDGGEPINDPNEITLPVNIGIYKALNSEVKKN